MMVLHVILFSLMCFNCRCILNLQCVSNNYQKNKMNVFFKTISFFLYFWFNFAIYRYRIWDQSWFGPLAPIFRDLKPWLIPSLLRDFVSLFLYSIVLVPFLSIGWPCSGFHSSPPGMWCSGHFVHPRAPAVVSDHTSVFLASILSYLLRIPALCLFFWASVTCSGQSILSYAKS